MAIHKNHLIIGLGGTGGNIIRSFRKMIYQNFRQNDPDCVNIRYLYADTSDEMMGPDDPTWKILGHSVQLPDRAQLKMGGGMQLKETVDNLASYPGIKPWIGDRQAFAGIIESANAANVIGGQKRRLGRFLFASHAAHFRERVREAVLDMQNSQNPAIPRSTETTFHVCCGLAGGTGSGSIVDAVSQIRATFPDPQYHIVIYALLPERQVTGGKGGPNYHANGYAALMELNALSIGSWTPHDITGVAPGRLDIKDPFNCCYLFNDENESNVRVDVIRELPEIVASFLFQKSVEIQKIRWGITNTLLRQETYEVGAQARLPEFSPTGKPRRARTFFSFGVKQIAYPEVEVREYLTYQFANQGALQLRFNKWIDGRGFVEEAVNQSFHEFVKAKATLENWYLTDERLSLSEGILEDEVNNKNWRPIADFWKTIIPQYVNLVIDTYRDDAMKMLPELAKRCDEVYKETYRGQGVQKFYEMKRRDIAAQAREIRSRIERVLFDEWKNGAKSMMDISSLLAALLESIEDRIKSFDDKIAKISEDSETVKENESAISKNREEWAKLGLLSRFILGKHKNILSAQAERFISRYTLRTKVEGFRYAKQLLPATKEEISRLASEVSKCSAMIADATKAFQAAIEARCQSVVDGKEIDVKRDFSRQVIRFFEPQAVRDFSQVLVVDTNEQRLQTGKIRAELTKLLGDNQTFAAFNNRITRGKFIDVLESTCEQSAIQAHEEYVARNPDRGRVLKVSLIEMMRKDFEGDSERMRLYAREAMSMSSNYVKLDQQQQQLVQTGIPAANNPENAVCLSMLTIVAPESPDAPEFRDQICQAFVNASRATTQVVTNPGRPQEITLINITSGFSARMVAVVKFLRDKYEARLRDSKNGHAFIELHLEGEFGSALPDSQAIFSLYPESYKPADFRPWAFLAEALGHIRSTPDAQTGMPKVYLCTKDEDGFDKLLELGPSLERVIQNPDLNIVEMVKEQVEQRLLSDYLHKTKRDELLDTVRNGVQQRIAGLSSNDPIYMEQREGFSKVKELLAAGR
jgi:hypothetical protein